MNGRFIENSGRLTQNRLGTATKAQPLLPWQTAPIVEIGKSG
jgi:hypothetical protein